MGAIVALVSGAVLVANLASAAPSRDTLLRPGVGAGNVRLGMTLAQVRAVLGKPSRIDRQEPYGFGSEYVEYAWGVEASWRVGVVGRVASASRVVFLATSRRERTRAGAGVGSAHPVLQRVLGARCYRQRSELAGTTYERDFYGCYLGKHGGPVTFFRLDSRCSLPRGRYYVCPLAKRRYFAYEVWIADRIGQELRGIREIR